MSSWVDRIADDEGYRRYAYQDHLGNLTIGYGINISDGGEGLDEFEARWLLQRKLKKCEWDLISIFGIDLWDDIDLVRKGALMNMRYQLGPSRFRGFEKMIDAVKQRKWHTAQSEALDSLWAEQVPNRAERVAGELGTGISI